MSVVDLNVGFDSFLVKCPVPDIQWCSHKHSNKKVKPEIQSRVALFVFRKYNMDCKSKLQDNMNLCNTVV